jgi:biopolymer transport protein ExbD
MKRNRKLKLKDAELSVSSMVDVVFLLLIYFIVVQKPITDDTLLKASLPSSPKIPVHQKIKPDFVKIEVNKNNHDNGNFYYKMNGKLWKDEKLFSMLKHIGNLNPDTNIVISCGPNARHEKLITLLDACSKAYLINLNIINDSSIQFKPEKTL